MRTTRLILHAFVLLFTLAPMPALAQLCTGLCLQQVTCANPAVTTTLSGTVYAPNGVDPLPGVLVYIPNAPVDALPAGATCRNGGTPPSAPLVQTITGVDGKFKVPNMPVGTNIPLVIQAGKWRRQAVIPNVAACTNTAISTVQTRFPRNHGEGDIPHFAVVTGSVDAAECVLRKVGIDDAEFSASSGTGRIHIFTGAGSPGASMPGSASETTLEASAATLGNYDMVMLPCQGDAYPQTPAAQQNLVDYANAGGRVTATHFEYTWLYNVVPFSATTTWIPNTFPSPNNQIGYINQSVPDGLQLAQWLFMVNASTTQGQIPLQIIRHDFDGVVAPSESWVSVNDVTLGNIPVQYSFDTPVGTVPANQCGRVEFLDYHVENISAAGAMTFPAECGPGAMTAQEKLIEYLMFDLTNNPHPALTLSIDNGLHFARYGNIATYTVHLVNNTSAVTNSVAVTSTLSSGLDAANALCVGSGGATCTTSAAGGLTASAIVAANSTATWVISVPVLAGSSDTTVEMDVSTPGATLATDIKTLVIFRDGYDVSNADGTQ